MLWSSRAGSHTKPGDLGLIIKKFASRLKTKDVKLIIIWRQIADRRAVQAIVLRASKNIGLPIEALKQALVPQYFCSFFSDTSAGETCCFDFSREYKVMNTIDKTSKINAITERMMRRNCFFLTLLLPSKSTSSFE